MSLHTNLQGRLRNTTLPKSHGLLPVFEAVVNSIHSLEEKGNLSTNGIIRLKVERATQTELSIESDQVRAEIAGFTVEDNGVGFNDENLESFETLDSDHKIDKGCRGVGRLLWLKAFDNVEINSTFLNERDTYKRVLSFDAKNGVKLVSDEKSVDNTLKTTISLRNFDKNYHTACPKTLESIANALLEHCLWYFVRPQGAPNIEIIDGAEKVILSALYDSYMYSSAQAETIVVKEQSFELTHIKFRASSSKKHSISLCAASRLVKEEAISGKIAGLYGKISDGTGEFTYSCYVSSPYLDERVRAERTSFDLAESVDDLFSDTEISENDIKAAVLKSSREYLKDYLDANIQAGVERVSKYVEEKSPRYRPILSRIEKDILAVNPDITDKKLELHLHEQLTEIERKLLSDGHEILSPKENESYDDYHVRLQEYLQTAEDIKKSDLASYVSHRRVILDLLRQAIQKDDQGKYSREDLIHELIMPMRKSSNDVFLDSCNLWLVDERLAFHDYLGSDKTLNSMPITDDSSNKEPDLCALNVCDNPILVSDNKNLPLASIVVVEIKRPMRNDAKSGEDKDPIEQALGYLNRIRKGQVKTSNGRPIPNSDDIPGYCYVICDLTPSVIDRCEFFDLTVTSDHMGYFGFHKKFKAYIEVISFDRLVNMANERNKAFFDKLGLPTT